jgi:hypothetical protein
MMGDMSVTSTEKVRVYTAKITGGQEVRDYIIRRIIYMDL